MNNIEHTNTLESRISMGDLRNYNGKSILSNNILSARNFDNVEVLYLKKNDTHLLNGTNIISKDAILEEKEDTAYVFVDISKDVNNIRTVIKNNPFLKGDNTFIASNTFSGKPDAYEYDPNSNIKVTQVDALSKINESDNGVFETHEELNVIVVGGIRMLFDTISYGFHAVTYEELIFEDSEYWEKLSDKLDPNKKTALIINRDRTIENGDEIISKSIAEKLGLSEIIYTKHRDIREKKSGDDAIVTLPFPNSTTFITPIELHGYIKAEKDVKVICLSTECADKFPKEILADSRFISRNWYDQGIDIDMEEIGEYIDDEESYVLAAGNSVESLVLKHLGQAFYENGYVVQGYTHHYSLYFNNVINILDIENSHYDNDLSNLLLSLHTYSKYLKLDQPEQLEFLETTAIVLVLGLISFASRNSKPGVALNLAIAVLLMNWESFITAPPEYYNQYLMGSIHYYYLIVFLAITLSLNSKVKYAIGLLVLIAPMPAIISINVFSLYLTVWTLGLLATKGYRAYLRHAYCIYDVDLPNMTYGEKLTSTLPFVDKKDKGVIMTSQSKAPSILFPKRKTYILRSNHKTFAENGKAGVFESHVVTGDKIESTIQQETEALIKQGLLEEQIQFWLQEFFTCKYYGVASSHSVGCEGKIAVAMAEHSAVTDGIENDVILIDRFDTSKPTEALKIPRKVADKLRKIEKATNQACNIEFGIQSGKVRVFQVREQDGNQAHDSHNAKRLREFNLKHTIKLENESYTPVGRSVLSRLYGDNVLFDSENTYVVMRNTSTTKDEDIIFKDAESRVIEFVERSSSLTEQVTLSQVLQSASCLMKDVLSLETNKLKMTETKYSIYKAMNGILMSREMILIDDLDVGSDTLKLSDTKRSRKDLPMSDVTPRDIVHSLITVLLNSISDIMIEKRIKHYKHSSVDSIESGEQPYLKDENDTDNECSETVIVGGDFDGESVTLTEFLKAPDSEKGKLVIHSETIPSSLITEAFKSKAIILSKGNELSHISITAKACNQSLKIVRKR